MSDRQALLDALLVERYGRNQWWTTPSPCGYRVEPVIPDHLEPDNEITCARRRRELVAEWEALDERGAG